MRDAQKQRVYDAEQAIRRMLDRAAKMGMTTFDFHGSTLTLPQEIKFGNNQAIQAYVDDVLAQPWYAEAGLNTKPISVRRRKGAHVAHYHQSEIAIPDTRTDPWAAREIVVLHEIAHHSVDYPHASHGPEFCRVFLSLVEHQMGHEARLALWDSMLANDVKVAS